MHKFDYSFLKNMMVSSNLLSLSNIIIDLKNKSEIKEEENPKLFIKLKEKSRIESIKASNEIEGIYTTEKRFTELIEKNMKPLSHDEEEILGYKNVYDLITNNYEYLNINEETILRFHSMLLEARFGVEKGAYKKDDNLIVEYDKDGNRKIKFRPVLASDTKENMKELILAYNIARNDSDINKFLLIPCFIVDFLSIHPFSDGNGRTSRLLTILLLYKSGFNICKYISFEKVINKYKWNYYDALEKSQKNWHENNNDYTPFIINFIQTLYQCYKELNEKFIDEKLGKKSKKEKVKIVILESIVPISKMDICDKLPDVSITTIELVLKELIDTKIIRKIGTYRDAKYIKNI